MFYEFNGHRPVVDASSFVHPQAAVTGDVVIGKDVYVGPGAAIRGDWGRIIIEDGCNIQENCTIHLFPGVTVRLREGAHIGHGAIVHGATIGRNCLIGMNAVIMDNVDLGDECIVGALSFVKTGEIIPPRSVVVGNPAKIVKAVSEEMLRWKTEGTAIYQALPGELQAGWKACEPLRPEEAGVAGVAGVAGEAEVAGEAGATDAQEGEKKYKPWNKEKSEAGPEDYRVEEPEAAYGEPKFTVKEYLEREEHSEWKHEYYKGEITMMAGAKLDHIRITGNLSGLVGSRLKNSGCEVFGNDLRVYIEPHEFLTYPDLSIVCGKPITFENDEWNLLNPATIVEVLSKSTAKYDRTEKFERYQALSSFQEYILVDSRSILVEQFIKDARGNWNSTSYRRLSDTITIATVNICMTLEEIYGRTAFPKLTH
ncbi:Uma2 family endonuclease [Puia sp.]|uniref:Uma2 family endonuclease n=1 Tax=Puia sp. TaxID=2045100 RepID=UPI002F425985